MRESTEMSENPARRDRVGHRSILAELLIDFSDRGIVINAVRSQGKQ